MKISKRQLKKIIKEEQQKLVSEMRQMDIDRAEGLYFNMRLSDKLVTVASDLITDAMDNAMEDGLDGQEAYELVHAVIKKLMRDADSKARY
tara:strand:+ start:205 stop:477 length:273 start_codon:yes stop_codon:yes gene_type:complete